MAGPQTVPLTPSVLDWEIESSGFSRADLAHSLGIEEEDISAWIHGARQPKWAAFKKLSSILKRPTATFFLPAPPPDQTPGVQFRPAPGDHRRKLLPEE